MLVVVLLKIWKQLIYMTIDHKLKLGRRVSELVSYTVTLLLVLRYKVFPSPHTKVAIIGEVSCLLEVTVLPAARHYLGLSK